jgi:hypothetical protein
LKKNRLPFFELSTSQTKFDLFFKEIDDHQQSENDLFSKFLNPIVLEANVVYYIYCIQKKLYDILARFIFLFAVYLLLVSKFYNLFFPSNLEIHLFQVKVLRTWMDGLSDGTHDGLNVYHGLSLKFTITNFLFLS